VGIGIENTPAIGTYLLGMVVSAILISKGYTSCPGDI
jgi:hypothetical protein